MLFIFFSSVHAVDASHLFQFRCCLLYPHFQNDQMNFLVELQYIDELRPWHLIKSYANFVNFLALRFLFCIFFSFD